jgi:hypothetical protein
VSDGVSSSDFVVFFFSFCLFVYLFVYLLLLYVLGMTSSSAAGFGAGHHQAVLRLYRAILRTHRKRMPHDLRLLGDAYVRDEFHAHRNVQPDQAIKFLRSWTVTCTFCFSLHLISICCSNVAEKESSLSSRITWRHSKNNKW